MNTKNKIVIVTCIIVIVLAIGIAVAFFTIKNNGNGTFVKTENEGATSSIDVATDMTGSELGE